MCTPPRISWFARRCPSWVRCGMPGSRNCSTRRATTGSGAGELLNAFDPSLDNSALADIGVYCLQHAALDLFGVPARTSGASVWLPNGFEGGGSLQLDYGTWSPTSSTSKIAAGLGPSVIYGEDAALTMDDPGELSRIELHPRGGAMRLLLPGPRIIGRHHAARGARLRRPGGRRRPRPTLGRVDPGQPPDHGRAVGPQANSNQQERHPGLDPGSPNE